MAATLRALAPPDTLERLTLLAASAARPAAGPKDAPAPPTSPITNPIKTTAKLSAGMEAVEKLRVAVPSAVAGASAWAGHMMEALTGPPPAATAIIPPTVVNALAAPAGSAAPAAVPPAAKAVKVTVAPPLVLAVNEPVAVVTKSAALAPGTTAAVTNLLIPALATPQQGVYAAKPVAPSVPANTPMVAALAAAAVMLLLSIAVALGLLLRCARIPLSIYRLRILISSPVSFFPSV